MYNNNKSLYCLLFVSEKPTSQEVDGITPTHGKYVWIKLYWSKHEITSLIVITIFPIIFPAQL